MIDQLSDSPHNDDQKQYMMKIQEAAHVLGKMIDHVLDFSKHKNQQLELEDAPFNLIQTIESCLDLLVKPAQAKQLAFYFCMMPNVPQHVRGDSRCLGLILLNLLAHAIQSTDVGTVAINVLSDISDDDQVRLQFDIYTTATDIASDDIPNPFETFPQMDTISNQFCSNTELRLFSIKQLVQLMQGHIDMQCQPDTGMLWRFNVRLRDCPEHDTPAPPPPFHQMPVVYIDSSELNRRLICNQLASWGMVPTTIGDASSVSSVLRTATQQPKHGPLVVIRHDPPTLDGHALCREIRRTEATAHAKIILFAATGEEANPLAVNTPPFDLSLIFPIRVNALYHALRQLVDHPHTPVSTCETTSSQPAEQASAGGPLNILLVEDNHVNQQVALSMLKKWGHRIDVAWNGLEALAAVKQQPYDLILMDIQMPEMDGITATRQIRQLEGKCASVPIVAVTANAMQGDRERFLAAGMDDYIAKPINRDTFYRAVHRYAPQGPIPQCEQPAAMVQPETMTPLLGAEVLTYLQNELSGETVAELIDEYMTHSSNLLSQALVASAEQDAKNVEYAVHTLKGMSGALGALRMVDVCQHILETCRNQGTQQIGPQMDGLSGATEETQEALRAWRAEHETC